MDYEKLGAFYLGRRFDPDAGEPTSEAVLYDAKDLTTHAVCVGMTGSGKTGLCVSLLEEAAIDGIPVLAIDPKGDLGNLLLTFPELEPRQFAPWVDPGEATRKGRTVEEHAKKTATMWREGLASWDQDGSRIARLRDSADFSIYTPGSNAGMPLTVLRSFKAPPQELLEDADAFRERVQAAASGIITLIGLDPDPLRSREHILVANLLDRAWRDGRDLAIVDLIREIQQPPFERLGVFELDAFFPAKDRFALAMSLNNLLASPGFQSWMEGDPLDIGALLWTPEGKPRVTILSIAHLADAERMFFVTILLNEVVAWMRTQSGTTSLRALLYMDEVFGYLPPTANPPSKVPMLTLLKQARAFGLGCVLATQNPVDLDYKALSNAGTWFLGRLQTERDKLRVLDGLETASSESGTRFDRKRIEATLSSLGSRVFLMNNVHEDGPVLFHTRWAMSYLRGPLTRAHIQSLMAERKAAKAADVEQRPAMQRAMVKKSATQAASLESEKPVLPPEIDEAFLRPTAFLGHGESLEYRPALLGSAKLHFISSSDDLDEWRNSFVLAPLDDDEEIDPWADAEPFEGDPGTMVDEGERDAHYADLPSAAAKARSYSAWSKKLKDHLYRTRSVSVFKCSKPKAVSKPGVTEGEFRAELRQAARELRDLEIEKLRKRYGPKIERMQERIQRAEDKVEKEKAQYEEQRTSSMISIGTTILGAIFGRKKLSARNVGRAATSARRVGRAARERGDIARAEDSLEALQPRLQELEDEFREEVEEMEDAFDVDALEITERTISPRKSDLGIDYVRLVWTPWRIDAEGRAEPLFESA